MSSELQGRENDSPYFLLNEGQNALKALPPIATDPW